MVFALIIKGNVFCSVEIKPSFWVMRQTAFEMKIFRNWTQKKGMFGTKVLEGDNL